MKVFIYVNKQKDPDSKWYNELVSLLDKYGVSHQLMTTTLPSEKVDAIFVLGGDGTILGLIEYATTQNVPIIGINAGKVGFLTEFERFETENVIKAFVNNELFSDERSTLMVEFNGKKYYALNDVSVNRIYTDPASIVCNVDCYIDGNLLYNLTGDGVIVSTPTGSTAYSLSAGGAILAPGINAFSLTPISPHSLSLKPVIYSSDLSCSIERVSGALTGLFIDGKLVGELEVGQRINIVKSANTTVFLRGKNSSFYKRLVKKLYNNDRG